MREPARDVTKPDVVDVRSLLGDVTEAQLRDAVASTASWRGVLRHLGMTSPRRGRKMRRACDLLEISYGHFSSAKWETVDVESLSAAVVASATWANVMERLGYATESGSARATLRRAALNRGIDTSHLSSLQADDRFDPFSGLGQARNVRDAAPFLVAARCALLGHGVSWPLDPKPYDLLVDTAQQGILRVQVKSGTHFAGGSWIVWITKQGRQPGGNTRVAYTREEIDYFGVVDPDRHVYMLPIEVVEGQSSVSLRKYESYRMSC
jgi:hypothetical protein